MYYKTYKFWIRFVNWKKGAVTGRTTLMEFADDIGINNWKEVQKLNLADAKRQKTEAYKELQRIKKDCPQ